ncbi:S8 family serine peptidase [Sulfitobacter pontiacus]|uniref:S8 family serine peptidase n=1 Tax=Sulfitobacter pontiacus TaxID=60137 RepID=UPI00104AA285|nr:S8 family serine peptidase [Sulfitobacter pontiacus]
MVYLECAKRLLRLVFLTSAAFLGLPLFAQDRSAVDNQAIGEKFENSRSTSEFNQSEGTVPGVVEFIASLPTLDTAESVRRVTKVLSSGNLAVQIDGSKQWVIVGSVLATLSNEGDYDEMVRVLEENASIIDVGIKVEGPILGSGLVRIKQETGDALTPEDFLQWLNQIGIGRYLIEIEPEPLVLLQDVQHGVNFSEDQWSFSNQGELEATSPAIVDADADIAEALALYLSGRMARDTEITVAVIDSGINISVPMLSGTIWVNQDEFPNNNNDDDGNKLVDDVFGWDFVRNSNQIFDAAGGHGHGTPVAGAIVAHQSGYQYISGAAPDAKVMPLNVVRAGQEVDLFAVAKAIDYAISKDVDIINMSFGTYVHSNAFQNMINQAFFNEILLVAAAGNDGLDVTQNPYYPCVYPGVICVGATTATDEKAPFSNYGEGTPNFRLGVSLGAPGERLKLVSGRGGTFIGSGTSYAAPLVSGTLAMLRAARPNEDVRRLRRRLLDGADHLRELDNIFSYGANNFRTGRRLNAYRSLIFSAQGLSFPEYCKEKGPDGYPRHQNYPYANQGDPRIDGSSFERAYTICTKRQLLSIREGDGAKHFKLMADIFWDEETHLGGRSMIGQNWKVPFNGNFNGSGFSIFNIEENLSYGWGLFKHLGPDSSVSHLNIRQMNVKSGGGSGGVSRIGEGILNYIQVEGYLYAEGNVGGLLGEAKSANIANSFYEGQVKSSNGNAGGLVGLMRNKSQIRKSGVRARIEGVYSGGISGITSTNSILERVFAYGNVHGSTLAAGVTAKLDRSSLRNSLTSGRVAGGGASGLVSQLANGFVENSLSISEVGQSPGGGGAIGTVNDIALPLEGVSNWLASAEESKRLGSSFVIGVYFLKGSHKPDGAAGIPKDFVELIDQSTYVGWNFGNSANAPWFAPSNKPELPRVKRVPRSRGAYHPDL